MATNRRRHSHRSHYYLVLTAFLAISTSMFYAAAEVPGAYASTSDVPLDFAKRLFETNYFAAIRMIQAVLPGMRAPWLQ